MSAPYKLPNAPIRRHPFVCRGGLDLVTPAIMMTPGKMISCSNYEAFHTGYKRIHGFERTDGRPKPSEASYWVLNFDAGTATIAEGATVTGATSAATGKALIAAVVSTGSYAGSDAAGYLVLTIVSGTFQDNEALQVAAVTKSTANGVATELGASSDANNSTWLQDAMETARALIGAVPGSGIMRGIHYFDGRIYAFRNNSGGTFVDVYKSTTSGWTLVSLGRSLPFTSGGVTPITVGQTVTGATSAATGVVSRVLLTSGSWAAGDAAGRFMLSSQTGTFQAENLNVGASPNLATIAANSSLNTLAAGGRFELLCYNFYATTAGMAMYGCDGVSAAFEFDGTIFTPIITGIGDEKPIHIAAHKLHLVLGFRGGIVGISETGEPQGWSGTLGAFEGGIGQEITGFIPEFADSMLIMCRSKVWVLYGADVDNFQLAPYSQDLGAIDYTLQIVGQPVFCDDAGIRRLTQSQQYGNFKAGVISQLVEPLFATKRAAGTTITASMRCRTKDQYRLFFSDGTGLSVFLDIKNPEFSIFDLGKDVHCTFSGEGEIGDELLLFGSDDGYVYELDAGNNFDGTAMTYHARLAFNNSGSAGMNKRYKKVIAEVDAAPTAALYLTAAFSYGHPDTLAVQEQAFTISGGGGFWNEANWNEFFWSSAARGQAVAYIDGIGENISMTIAGSSTYESPHVIHGIIQEYTDRGAVK